MAKPAQSVADRKKALIDDQEYVSQKEKDAAKKKIDEEEKKKKAAEQARANKEADLIGAKDAAKLSESSSKKENSSGVSTKKENSSRASEKKESSSGKVSSPKKSNLGTSKQAASDLIAKAAGAEEGVRQIEAAKTEKAAAQARKNKEADLPGFDGHAAQKAYQQKVEREKIEYLDTKEARDKKYALEQELAELKAQAKNQTKEAETVQIVASGRKGGLGSFVDPETQKRIDELEKQISDLNKNITLASRAQEKKYLYNRASGADDFSEYSKEPQKEDPAAIRPHQQNIGRETETLKGYMTDEERAVYNYYFNKFGEAKAEEFFESIEEDLNFRQAQAIFAGNEGKVFNEYIQGAVAGLEDAKEGYKGTLNMLLGIDEEQPTSTYDFLSGMAREDLGNSGIKLPEALGGASLGQIGFDVVNTTANMLPSIMLGTLGGSAAGAVGIGASAAGNAYNEAIKAGYDKEQATNYAALVGASEASLGYLLGGIEATGGKISNAVLGKLLPKIDNALAKAAVNVGGKMLSEFSEEYLQEVLSPVFENIALMEENEIDLLSPEAIYSGILGALSAGGIAAFDGSANVPEVFEKAEVPVPFDGKAEPGTEAALVADKITEIENRPISEAEKAAKMEEVMQAVAETTGTAEVIAEAEKFKNIHEQNAEKQYPKELNSEEIQEIKKGAKIEIDETGEGIINITSDILKNVPRKNWINRVKTVIKTIFPYGFYLNGEYVEVSNNSRKEFTSSKYSKRLAYENPEIYADKMKTAPYLDIISQNAKDYNREDAEHDRKDNIIEFERGNITLKIGKNEYIADVVIGVKDNGGKKFYDITNIENKKSPQPGHKKADTREGGLIDVLSSDNIISPIDGKSNPPSIGNNVFGAGIFGNQNSETVPQGKSIWEITREETPESMKRASDILNANDWMNIAESIDVETGIWRMKDLARVLDSAAGGNKILRQQLYELYEKPLNEAQGTYAANYEAKAKEISDKFKELGIKAGSNESAAVQRIGEGVKEIDKNGNTVPYTLDDLKKEFPDSWEKIKAGADYCREIYDKFLVDLNAMYSEIYPATVEQANERVSNYDVRILSDSKKIGNIKEVRNNLEMDIIRKTAELSKKRPNTLVYAEIQNQIENAKRRIEKANRIIEKLENRKLTKEIARDTLKAQIENGEILQNKQIRPRADYFRHFQELTNEFAEIADIFSNDQRIPPNLAGKSETTKPRTIWTSIAQNRGKNYYTEDAVGGLLRYTEIAEKLLAYDPLISHFRDVNSAIRTAGTMVENEVSGKGTNAGQFASWADDITNQLAGKTNKLDRLIADNTGALGRATIKAVEALNRRVKSNAILGNFRSALVQIGNLPNATLYIQNPIDWRNGVVSTISSVTGHSPEIKEARNNSNFMNRRYMGDSIDEITKEIQQNKILDKPKEFAIWMLGAGDRAAAEVIWHTAYTRALRNPEVLSSQKGQREYDSAIDYADDITRRSIGGRAEGDIPYFEESKITGLVAPFQIEVANTFNAFSEQLGKKNAAGIVAFEISVFLLNTVLEGITGDRPLGLDFIDAALDIIKEATGDEEDEEEKDLWDIITYAGGRIGGEVLSSMPFGTQIGSALTGGDEQKAEDWFGDSDPTRYGTGNIGIGALADAVDYFREGETPEKFYDLITDGKKNSYSEWAKPVLNTVDTFAPLVMPWGGKQLSRTLGGLDQIIQGGAYGEKDGEPYLKYLQDQDPANILKTLVFGRYGGDSAQEYIDSGFKGALSAKQTEQMELAEEYGVSKEDFYDTILGLREFGKKEDKQEAILQNEDLDAREKSIIDWILFGKQDNFPESTRDYTSPEAFYRSGLETGELRLYEDGFDRKEIETIEKALEKGGTKAEDIAAIQKAMNCTEAEAFEIYQKRNGNWIDDAHYFTNEQEEKANSAADFYNMSTDDYLTVLNYSKFGTVVTDENGEESYSTKMEDVVPKIMEATGWDKETATKNYLMVNKYEYSRNDLEEERVSELDTSQNWYEVEDKGFFVARNVLKTVEGTKDENGNTIDGSFKEAAVKEIAKRLGIDETEATIYYLAAKGDLVLSTDDMETTQIEDMKEAIENGWTERQFIDAMNVIKVSGASKKEEILKALQDAGATYEMAQGYYNLKENADYDRFVGKVTYKYGVQKKKQEVKCDYFLRNYNGDGSVTAKDLAKWFAAGAGCKKKQEYIDAYMSAGATYSQALKFYSLMQGHDKTFNSWYKENGG